MTVVEGNFRLEVGQHVVTGDNAVVWITETPAGESVRRKIVVYVEGRARVIEPSGSTTADRTIVVHLNQEGRLTANAGKTLAAKPEDLPVFARGPRQGSGIAAGHTAGAAAGPR